ncbi:MAG: hypothetical protein ACLP75_09520 [Mycobacterium sp.]
MVNIPLLDGAVFDHVDVSNAKLEEWQTITTTTAQTVDSTVRPG